jgi:hypothetical protein
LEAAACFWRIKDLKQRLARSPLKEGESLPYLLANVGGTTLALFVPSTHNDSWSLASAALTVFLSVGGVTWVFRANGGSAGCHFLQRYFAVGWVVFVRVIALVFPIAVVLFALSAQAADTQLSRGLEVAVVAAAQLLFYGRVAKHIGDVARATTRAGEPIAR